MAEPDGRKVRAAERREETRERLLAAALEVFAEQGFHAGTTRAITQRAGVAEGLLFHYFPTKADLMLAVLARDPLGPEMRRLLQEEADQPLAEALPRMARRWLAVIRAHRAVTRVLLQEAHLNPQVQRAVLALALELTELLAGYFAARVAAGELRPIDPRAAAYLLLQALFGLGMQCEAIPDGEEERVLDRQIDLLLYGMLAPAARGPAGGAAS
jgi:AcrR family transcriptional regulator